MTSTGSENGRTIARRFIEDLWDKGELAVADEIIASDFVDHDPVSGQRAGLDGYKEMVGAFRAAFPDLRVKNEDVIVEEDKVVVRWTARGGSMGIEWSSRLGLSDGQKNARSQASGRARKRGLWWRADAGSWCGEVGLR